MTLNNRYRAMLFDTPGEIPVVIGFLPAVWMKYREQMHELTTSFPHLFSAADRDKNDYDAVTGKYVEGNHIDAWGCVWSNVIPGMTSIVTGHPLSRRSDIQLLEIPKEDEGLPHGFMFLRLADLRGFEEIMLDFAEEPPELQMLIDKVLTYNLRQAALKLSGIKEKGQIIYFGDDLGMQHALPISPNLWRKYLIPCFKEIFKIFIDAGHYVYFHSDGHMIEIIPDLIDCGISVINPQSGANGIANIAAVCKGKVCVDIDLDRQLFPFASKLQLEEHVHEAVEKLYTPQGGLWIIAAIDQGVPFENIRTICELLTKYRHYPELSGSNQESQKNK